MTIAEEMFGTTFGMVNKRRREQGQLAVLEFDESQHPRDPDGKFASGGGNDEPVLDVSGNIAWAQLPLSQRRAIEAYAKQRGWPDRDGMRRNLVDLWRQRDIDTFPYTGHHDTAEERGIGWYARTAQSLDDARTSLVDRNGQPLPDVEHEAFAAMAAAIASNSPWEAGGKSTETSFPNLEMTSRIATILSEDPEVTITEHDVGYWAGQQGNIFSYLNFKDTRGEDSPAGYAVKGTADISEFLGTHRLSELPNDVVARIGNSFMASNLFSGSGSTTGWPNIALAVGVWRGQTDDPRGLTPDEALGGNKIRAFYNAMVEGGAAEQDVVVDRWEGRAATGIDGFKNDALGTPAKYIENPDWIPNVGSYPLFADAIIKGAAQVGVEPSDFQAVTWYVAQAQRAEEKAAARAAKKAAG